jgi:hypothetical protein
MKITVALLFVLMINVLLVMAQTSVNYIAEDEGLSAPQFFVYDNSLLSQVDAGNYTVTGNVSLGNTGGQVEVDSGNVFTDTFTALKNWVSETTGFNYLVGIVKAMPTFLSIIGLPQEIAYSLGALWHIFTLFLVISWIGGRP